MCGLTALIDPRGEASLDSVVRMTRLVAHRGPDSEGFALLGPDLAVGLAGPDTDPSCICSGTRYSPVTTTAASTERVAHAVLGHRRLSILDLSPTGHQPMASEDGVHWIVFNGEIYNYVELRQELVALGHRFVGNSDTEVLLTAFREWGEGCLARLRGMFAFVVVDRRRGIAFAARDRFGIKPLYYAHLPHGAVALASEVKQLVSGGLRGITPSANGVRLYDFLASGILDHTAETMFAEVHQVPPGGCMTMPLDRPHDATPTYWWNLSPGEFQGSFHEAADTFLELTRSSISEHLRADVAVGSCLSGGLDSSTIVCLIQERLKDTGAPQQRTFTASSTQDSIDESPWAQLIIDRVGSDALFAEPDLDGLGSLLPSLTWHMDEPFGSTSIVAQWTVFRLAAESGTKVVLDGQGADEQLAGYTPYFAWYLAELLTRGRLQRCWDELRALRTVQPQLVRRTLLMLADLLAPPAVSRWGSAVVPGPRGLSSAWIDRSALGVVGHPTPARDATHARRTVQGLARSQLMSTNLPMLLHYEDRDSMAHSVESRVPFLDHRLVEFTTSLPADFLISQGRTKLVLREAMKDVLPDPTRMRVDKIGFQTAEERWMRSHPQEVLTMVSESIDALGGAVHPSALEMAGRVVDGSVRFDHWVWRAISAGSWVQRFGVSV